VDLAKDLILLSGLQPGRDVQIEFTGLRPGEKLYEELSMQDECLVTTSHTQIKSYICTLEPDAKQMKAYLHELQQIYNEQDVGRLVLLLKEMIPDYNPGSQLLRSALPIRTQHAKCDEIFSHCG
jgi:FlaA1/EpsC-like NDP-sugar epimerase